jgi:cytidine deaminase
MQTKQTELIARARDLVGKIALPQCDFTAADVAAAILTPSGTIYTGVCLDLSCGIGFCAEHAAIAEMVKARETQIEMIVAVCEDGVIPPCGRCREMMIQVDRRNVATIVLLAGGRQTTLRELLPEHWLISGEPPKNAAAPLPRRNNQSG